MNLYANNPIKHPYSFGIQWSQRQSSIDITISYKIPNEFKNISKLSSNINSNAHWSPILLPNLLK